jgi:hypothetical protein
MTRIRTAVFPVAGRGTRFLPATKASPKEMLPIVDKPLIQYAAEEALEAGADKLVFITGASKRAIEDHFDTDHELERSSRRRASRTCSMRCAASCRPTRAASYIRQPAPLGLGHAVLCSRPVVGDEPFFIHLADDLIDAPEACLAQMARVFSGATAAACSASRPSRLRRPTSTASWRLDPIERAPVAGEAHRREAEARGRAVEPRGGGPLPADARHLRQARDDRARRGRRDPAHRRHRRAARRRGRLRLCLRGQAVRLRLEAGLPRGDRRVRAQAPQNLGDRSPTTSRDWSRSGCAQAEPTRIRRIQDEITGVNDVQRTRTCRVVATQRSRAASATSCPCYVERARNAEMWDVEGRRYIDFGSGIAVLNTGHLHPKVQAAVALGSSSGSATPA